MSTGMACEESGVKKAVFIHSSMWGPRNSGVKVVLDGTKDIVVSFMVCACHMQRRCRPNNQVQNRRMCFAFETRLCRRIYCAGGRMASCAAACAALGRSWSSGRILPCHGRDPGSIPGERTGSLLSFCLTVCMFFFLRFLVSTGSWGKMVVLETRERGSSS